MGGSEDAPIPFKRLDFGETEILNRLYGASAAVLDVTERSYQAAMFCQPTFLPCSHVGVLILSWS